jgi:CMP-N-acetylneuraminic acid synthetase
LPTRRQDVGTTYIRDGTVYAFPVKTLTSGTIYGQDVRPLLIPADESCELDTESDWADVERRWRERAKHL